MVPAIPGRHWSLATGWCKQSASLSLVSPCFSAFAPFLCSILVWQSLLTFLIHSLTPPHTLRHAPNVARRENPPNLPPLYALMSLLNPCSHVLSPHGIIAYLLAGFSGERYARTIGWRAWLG